MKRFFLSLIFLTSTAIADPLPEYTLPSDVELLIPKQVVRVRWLLPPSKKKTIVPEIFDVDKDGNPWFGYQGRTIAHPLKGAVLWVSEPFQGFAWTDDGGFLLTNGKSLGYLIGVHVQGAAPQRLMKTAFKPVIELPHENDWLYPGDSNHLFLSGQNPKTKKYEVFSIEIKNKIASVRNILESDTAVNYVASARGNTWVAIGRVVAKINLKRKTLEPIFAHPTEPVREFVHVPNVGFFYVTSSGLGFYKKGLQYQFMSGANLRIRLKNKRLYVLMGQGHGLLRLDGLRKFAFLAPPAKKAS
jgi:hypothetical protein